MKFSQTHKDLYGNEEGTIEMTVPIDTGLEEVLITFTDFLRGCGFVIPYDKHLELVSEDELYE